MSYTALLWSSSQLASLRNCCEHGNHSIFSGAGRVPFRSCQARRQQMCRSQRDRHLEPAIKSAHDVMQLSRRDMIVTTLLALQLPALLPRDAAQALG